MKPIVLTALAALALGSVPTYCLACHGHRHQRGQQTSQTPANTDQANSAGVNQDADGGDKAGGQANNNLWVYKGTITAGPDLHVTVSHYDRGSKTTQSKSFMEDSSTVILIPNGTQSVTDDSGTTHTETTYGPGKDSDLQAGKTVQVFHEAGSDVPVTIKVLPAKPN